MLARDSLAQSDGVGVGVARPRQSSHACAAAAAALQGQPVAVTRAEMGWLRRDGFSAMRPGMEHEEVVRCACLVSG